MRLNYYWRKAQSGKSLEETSLLSRRNLSSLTRATDYPLPQAFEQAYKEADRLAFEVSPEETDPTAAASIMQEGVYTNGSSLRDVLSPEAYAALAKQGEKSNLPIAMLERFKPGLAIMMLTMQELAMKGLNEEGVDLYFSNRATKDGKPTEGLETSAFQIDLLCNMEPAMKRICTLLSDDLGKIQEMIDPLLDAWKIGNTTHLKNSSLKTCSVIRNYTTTCW